MQQSRHRAANAPALRPDGRLRTNGLALLAAISMGIWALASLSGSASFERGAGGTESAIGTASGGFVARPSFSDRDSSRPDFGPPPERAIRLSLSKGTRVIVASLDTTARRHELQLHWQPMDIDENVMMSPPSIDVRILAEPCELSCRSFTGDGNQEPQSSGSIATGHAQCESETEQARSEIIPPPAQRVFDLPWFVPGLHHQPVGMSRIARCEFVLSSSRVSVYTNGQVTDESRFAARTIIQQCMSSVLPLVASELGAIRDVDADGRLTFVLCDLAPASSDYDPPILGCVRSTDYAPSMSELPGDIVYLDRGLPVRPELAAVLAHECAHAAIFSALSSHDNARQMPVWLNEAIAHAIEAMLVPDSANLTKRKRRFLRDPQHYPLFVRPDCGGTMTGRGPERAAGLLFAQFVRSRVIPLMALVQGTDDDVGRIESALRTDFEDAFRAWTLDLLRQHESGAIDLTIQQLASSREDRPTIRGTAAMWGRAERDGVLELRSSATARLQVTVIRRREL